MHKQTPHLPLKIKHTSPPIVIPSEQSILSESVRARQVLHILASSPVRCRVGCLSSDITRIAFLPRQPDRIVFVDTVSWSQALILFTPRTMPPRKQHCESEVGSGPPLKSTVGNAQWDRVGSSWHAVRSAMEYPMTSPILISHDLHPGKARTST